MTINRLLNMGDKKILQSIMPLPAKINIAQISLFQLLTVKYFTFLRTILICKCY